MKLLITGCISWDENQKKELIDLGHELIFIQGERIPLIQQKIDISGIEGVICNGLFLYNDIKMFKSLKYIQLTSAGFDRVPLDYIKANNLTINNARGVYGIPMAEFVLSNILSFYKKISFFRENQQTKKWIKDRNIIELFNKKICIIGCGNVGTECAKRFKAFDCCVYGVDLLPFIDNNYDHIYSLDDLNEVISKVDIVVLTVPLTNKTKNLIDYERLNLLKEHAILINISRGGVLNTNSIVKISKEKNIYFILDVFDEEPLCVNSELWGMKNVVITPHNSFVGEGNRTRLQKCIIENLIE